MKTIDTALILTAGNGTRRLPITRVIDKVMLPIGNRPAVDYVVEQCAAAGIRRIVFVVQRQGSQISQYYGKAIDISQEYPWLNMEGQIAISYVVHDQAKLGYGTAPAVLCARQLLADTEQFIVVAGDGFLHGSAQNPLSMLIAGCNDVDSALLGLQIPAEEASNFGILAVDKDHQLVNLSERPAELPAGWQPLANISYYAFSQAIFPELEAVKSVGGEYRLTDAILSLSGQSPVRVVPIEGEFLDSGLAHKWVAANQRVLDSGK